MVLIFVPDRSCNVRILHLRVGAVLCLEDPPGHASSDHQEREGGSGGERKRDRIGRAVGLDTGQDPHGTA